MIAVRLHCRTYPGHWFFKCAASAGDRHKGTGSAPQRHAAFLKLVKR